MVSAIKQGGVPLYKLARKGIEVERKQRLIHIYQFSLSRYEPPRGDFRVVCTKGTYVRTLVHDLGQKLGCGAHLASLRRLVSGRFDLADAHTLPDIMKLSAKDLEARVIPFRQLTGGA
jgi:tRNA pseudouridine55 synthase